MQWLKQSTAASVNIGPFLDDTDGKTAETLLTIAQADVRLAKAHGAYAQKTEISSCTHLENGWYDCPLDATDTGTLGVLQLAVHEAGALPVWHDYLVLPANVFDSLVSGSDALQVHANEITANLITAAAIATGAIDADAIAADAITAAKIAPDAIGASELAADAVTEIQSGLATSANVSAVEADTQDIQTRLPAVLVAGRIDASVGAVAAGAVTAAAIATDAIDADALAADALTEIFTKIWTTALTEAYAADGAAPTPAQAVFLIQQMLTEMSISGVTMTVKRLDGSTTAATFTLDSATSPTSLTRAT